MRSAVLKRSCICDPNASYVVSGGECCSAALYVHSHMHANHRQNSAVKIVNIASYHSCL